MTAVNEKRFRQDLYYRLNVARFVLPPLRERREDVALLFGHFLEKYNRKMQLKARAGEGVIEALTAYDFPGNVRELENIVEQAVALSGGGLISVDDVLPSSGPLQVHTGTMGKSLADVVDSAERQAIETALRENDGSRDRAAEILGISVTTLWRKMTRLGISYPTS